eukprot:TRINITY_DN8862_c0_g1_i3.p1 TRINITY_DN8862_c0_g1~~TRINITY_DN8862_c0_g1_i3.p1  ORF type:complete len:353 (-),score=99.55 TRINITY_DN8862_c0_g1_i3:39-1097(-)
MLKLESFISSILSNEEKIILKLKSPLGVVSRILKDYKEDVIASRKAMLREDVDTLAAVEDLISSFESDLRRDFSYHQSQVDNVMLRMLDRCDEFLNHHLTIGKAFQMLHGSKLAEEFEKFVAKDFMTEIEEQVSNTMVWILDKNSMHSQSISSFILRRSEKYPGVAGKVGAAFFASKQNVLQDLQRSSRQAAAEFDRKRASADVLVTMRNAVLQTIAVELSAVGLGAFAVTAAGTAASIDVTGITGAGLLALTGLYVIPFQRNRVKDKLRDNINRVRRLLKQVLEDHFNREAELSARQIRDSFANYSHFVRNSTSRVQKLESKTDDLANELQTLNAELSLAESRLKQRQSVL